MLVEGGVEDLLGVQQRRSGQRRRKSRMTRSAWAGSGEWAD